MYIYLCTDINNKKHKKYVLLSYCWMKTNHKTNLPMRLHRVMGSFHHEQPWEDVEKDTTHPPNNLFINSWIKLDTLWFLNGSLKITYGDIVWVWGERKWTLRTTTVTHILLNGFEFLIITHRFCNLNLTGLHLHIYFMYMGIIHPGWYIGYVYIMYVCR